MDIFARSGMLCELEQDATGKRWFLQICPWWFLQWPSMREVSDAWRWWDKGQLETRYPDPPVVLLNAVTQFDRGLTAGQADKMKRQMAENEKKRNQ